ncbi:MAG TPA: DUF4129 domain-containing protein [Pilimelia sp.]|nr:DUF4129 domain-containing protein [Pilimelia sp.]
MTRDRRSLARWSLARRSPAWWPLGAVAVLLGLLAVAAAHATPQLSEVEGVGWDPPATMAPRSGGQPPAGSPGAVTGEPLGLPSWLRQASLLLCGLAVAAAVAAAVPAALRRRVRGRSQGPTPDRVAEAREVLAAVDAGLEELDDADADPRRAVIACWVRLEQAAAAAGTARGVADTPAELVGRLLTAHAVSADVLAALAAVYREARYATRPVTGATRDRARAALHRLRAELAAPAPARTGAPWVGGGAGSGPAPERAG